LVRRSIWEYEDAQPWHPVVLTYAQAVRELQTRDASEPASWIYQAAIHGTSSSPPAQGWNQCQHGAWYFLPWHRLYLYYFERIIRSVVLSQGGPDDWALPYWHYDAGGTTNTLPSSFRQQTLPDGTPNPLFVANRNPAVNAGVGLPAQATSAAVAMGMSNYLPPPFPGFGGGQTNGPQHFFNAFGALEQTPHNVIHVMIGGLMSDPDTAALDPIFWLHHCNIDRLWMEWNAKGGVNPGSAAWTGQTFELFDENGTAETRPLGDTNDPIGVLGYRYDTVPPELPEVQSEAMPETPSAAPEPEMVGAAEDPVVLTGGSQSVELPVDPRAARDALESATADHGGRVYLSLEHVDAETTPGQAYAVYLEAAGEGQRRHHVGNLALFGIEKLHEARGGQGPHHQRFVYDVTEIAAELGDPTSMETLRVTFEQLGYEPGVADDAEAVEAQPELVPIRVGRVTLRRG
jgi:hypothetical protein